jgi:hypothetical protein
MIAAVLLGNVNITKQKKAEGDEGYGDNVDHGIYVLSFLRGRRGSPAVDAEKTTTSKHKDVSGKSAEVAR